MVAVSTRRSQSALSEEAWMGPREVAQYLRLLVAGAFALDPAVVAESSYLIDIRHMTAVVRCADMPTAK